MRETGGFPVNIDTKQASPLGVVCVCVHIHAHMCEHACECRRIISVVFLRCSPSFVYSETRSLISLHLAKCLLGWPVGPREHFCLRS